jgi:hypothetical protein
MNRRTAAGAVSLLALVLLASAWSAPAPQATKQGPAVQLSRRISFAGYDDPKMTLAEALDDLAKKHHITFDLNEKAFTFEQLKDVLKTPITESSHIPAMKDVTLATILRKVFERVPVASGATWMVRDDLIEITTRTFQAAEVWGTYNGPHLPLVSATLEKVPLEDAVQNLATLAQFNVLLDNRAGEKAKTPVSARLRNTPLDTAVRLLSDMADLRSVHLDNVLFVTTKENAAAMEARLVKEKGNEGSEEPGSANVRRGSGPGVPPNAPGGM